MQLPEEPLCRWWAPPLPPRRSPAWRRGWATRPAQGRPWIPARTWRSGTWISRSCSLIQARTWLSNLNFWDVR
jgi:hypothetical protein